MPYQTLQLMMEPMSQPGSAERVSANRLTALNFLTSNLGANEMSRLINGAIGFAPVGGDQLAADELEWLGDIVVIDIDSSEKKLAFFRDDHEPNRAAAALQSIRLLGAGQRNSIAA